MQLCRALNINVTHREKNIIKEDIFRTIVVVASLLCLKCLISVLLVTSEFDFDISNILVQTTCISRDTTIVNGPRGCTLTILIRDNL